MKNRMKRAAILLIALVMLVATACSGDTPDTTPPDTLPTESTEPIGTEPDETESDTAKEDEPVITPTVKENALILELLKASTGREYGSFAVYVQTSDPSGDYYIKYNFAYEYNDTRDNYKSNTTTNISNYRVKSAQLVKVTAVGDAAVISSKVYDVLQQGEISLAISQDRIDTSLIMNGAEPLEGTGGGVRAADFIGGYHGDERIESASLTADGAPVDLSGTAPRVIVCTTVTFDQLTTLYKWGTSNADSFGVPAATHSQSFSIDSNGVRNRQSVKWLCSDFYTRANETYLQMFTMKRLSGSKTVCEIIETFDEKGNSLGKETVGKVESKNITYLSNVKNRTVRYSSATSGVFSEAGFRIVEGVAVEAARISARVDSGAADNKWYVSFKSAKNGRTPAEGEVWTVEVYYTIDYIKPEA